jgi:hypothetical protein
MNEEEAKTKWCPLAQIALHEACATIQTCAGSNCMLWRWTGKCETGLPLTRISVHGPTELGYCGLGGKP